MLNSFWKVLVIHNASCFKVRKFFLLQIIMSTPPKSRRRLFHPTTSPTPIAIESNSRSSKRSSKKRAKIVRKKRRTYRRLNLTDFASKYGSSLGRPLLELSLMKMKRRTKKFLKYTPYQKWLATNIMVAGGRSGYATFRRMFPLPSESTIKRALIKFKNEPGLSERSTELMKLKNDPRIKENKYVFILIDEMSCRLSLEYNQTTGTIHGFEDDGEKRTRNLASSALCLMVVGVVKKWKFPLGYFLCRSTMESTKITQIIQSAISITEEAGYTVFGITTDQGSNFEKCFRYMGVTAEKPTFTFNDKSYYVYRDPPHLLKNARNYLSKPKTVVSVPEVTGNATWDHIRKLLERDERNSLKYAPKLKRDHVDGLKFSSSMKVKLAAHVLSRSVSVALDYMVAEGAIDESALATSKFCLTFNDLFDIMNSSSPRDKVILRRPLHVESPSLKVLTHAKVWLKKLARNNGNRKCYFIGGFIQSINVLLDLIKELKELGHPYLSTRNLCQDPLELFFGKVRQIHKFTTAANFSSAFGQIAAASLLRSPLTGNCEEQSENQDDIISSIEYVSTEIILGLPNVEIITH